MRLSPSDLHAVAIASNGIVSRQSLIQHGEAANSYRRRLERGELVEIHSGISRLASHQIDTRMRIAAAIAALGGEGFASHRSAAWLHGVKLEIETVDITVPNRPRHMRLDDVRIHRPRDHMDIRPIRKNGIATTNPLRILVDIGAPPHGDVETTMHAMDHFLVNGQVRPTAISTLIDRHSIKGRSGIVALRQAFNNLANFDRPPDSVLEVRMLELLRDAALPSPKCQHYVGADRLDFAYPEWRVNIECDGWAFHSTQSDRSRDISRDARLMARGWTVIRFSWYQIIKQPLVVASTIGGALAHRTAA